MVPSAGPSNAGFVTPCASNNPSPTRGVDQLVGGALGFIGRLLPTIVDAPGSAHSRQAFSPSGSLASAEKANRFGGVLPVSETVDLVEEEVQRRVRIATADAQNKALALEAQVSQLKARVAELLCELAERDDAAARDRARWAALRGDAAALAGMSVAELQGLVRGQEEALGAAKEALQRKGSKAAPLYL